MGEIRPAAILLLLGNQYNRGFAGPIDIDTVFATTADRIAYLQEQNRYAGQIVSDLQQDAIYILNSTRDTWINIGTNNNSYGTYTPVLTKVLRISSTVSYPCQYMRVGNVVTVSGKVDFSLSNNGVFELGVSLPVSSFFTHDYQCAGSGQSVISPTDEIYIKADVTNKRASINGSDNNQSLHSHFFSFTYLIV